MVARAPELEVVAEATDGAEAERLARTVQADLLLLDIALPVKRGMQVLESLRKDGVSLPVLIFSMYPAEQYASYARKAGAQGFVSKEADSADLLRAIRRVAAGGTSFPRAEDGGRKAAMQSNPFAVLSAREAEVMQGLVKGSTLREIAAGIGVGAKSVTTYRRRLLDKLGVRSNAELVALAARFGYV